MVRRKGLSKPGADDAGAIRGWRANNLLGPGFHNWDISLLKNFQLHERARMQFRFESFNIFNHPNFTGINTTCGSTRRATLRPVSARSTPPDRDECCPWA